MMLPSTTSAIACKSCRTLPEIAPDTGVLYLAPPADEPRAALSNRLREIGLLVTEPIAGVLAIPLAPGLLDRLVDNLSDALTETEIQNTRSLIGRLGVNPTLADLMNTQSLGKLLGQIRHRWLVGILRDERLLTHFQPIVPANDPSSAWGYECLTRGIADDGRLIPPFELFTAARAAGLLFHLDRQARMTAIQSATTGQVPHEARLFVNFNPSSIYTPSFCLRSTFEAVEAAGLNPDRVVFEVVESEEVRDTEHLLGILQVYRKAGFAVALDDVGAGYSSLNLLSRLRPDYVKLDMGLTRGVDTDPYKAQVVGKLLEMARGLGVLTVFEGVETVGEWEWAKAHHADYVQGYLFARPANPAPRPVVPRQSVMLTVG